MVTEYSVQNLNESDVFKTEGQSISSLNECDLYEFHIKVSRSSLLINNPLIIFLTLNIANNIFRNRKRSSLPHPPQQI